MTAKKKLFTYTNAPLQLDINMSPLIGLVFDLAMLYILKGKDPEIVFL